MKNALMAMAILPLLAGCMVVPLNAPPKTATALLKMKINTAYTTQAEVNTYKKADINHLQLELWKGGSKVATKDVLKVNLDDVVTVKNLLANTSYQVRCFAYKAAGVDPADLINLDDENSHTDITITNDSAAVVNSIKVKLIDTPFGAEGTNSIAVTDGVFLPIASESF